MASAYRVAIVVRSLPPDVIGGTETQTMQMATQLERRGHDVTVYTKRYGDTEFDAEFDVRRIRHCQWSPFLSDLTFLALTLLALVRNRREHDLLQCMMLYPFGFLGYVVHRLTGLPYFAWIRGNDFYAAKDVRWKRWMIRRVVADALVLVQAPDIEADVRAEFPDLDPEIDVVGNGVSIPDEQATLDGDTVLYLGRLAPKKGVEYLIEAMDSLDADSVELVVVGDGSERDRLESHATRVDADVTFVGEITPDEVGQYYRTASVLVLPSVAGEGLPNVVLEAMSWGIPVVTTGSGGLPSLVDDRRNGYVIPMRDPEAIAEAVDELLDDPEIRTDVGRTARTSVQESYSWPVICSELEGQYRSLTMGNSDATDARGRQ